MYMSPGTGYWPILSRDTGIFGIQIKEKRIRNFGIKDQGNRWSFSYLKFTKYVTNIIAEPKEPKYKYGQQEQVTVRNHNRSTTLKRSVLKYLRGGGLKSVLRVLNLAHDFCHGSTHTVVRSA